MEAELYTPITGTRAGLALYPGTPVSARVGILNEPLDIQTLNSYARLIWVRTHSPKRSTLSNARQHGESATFRSFCTRWVRNMMTVISGYSWRGWACRGLQGCAAHGLNLAASMKSSAARAGGARSHIPSNIPNPIKQGFREPAQYPAKQICRRARSNTGRACGYRPRSCRRSPASAQRPRTDAHPRRARATGSTTRPA